MELPYILTHVPSTIPIIYYDFFPLPPRLVKQPSKYSKEPCGQTKKLSNPAYGLIPIVNNENEWKPWSICYANVNYTQSYYGTGLGMS
jgi:hypothetical protein